MPQFDGQFDQSDFKAMGLIAGTGFKRETSTSTLPLTEASQELFIQQEALLLQEEARLQKALVELELRRREAEARHQRVREEARPDPGRQLSGSARDLEFKLHTGLVGSSAKQTSDRNIEKTSAETVEKLIGQTSLKRIDNEETRRRAGGGRLRIEADEESLRRMTEELALRTNEIETACKAAREEIREIDEIKQRLRDEQAARRLVKLETLRLEAEAKRALEEAEQRFEEMRHNSAAHQQRIEKLASAHVEKERIRAGDQDRRLAELEALRKKAGGDVQVRAARQQQLCTEIERLRRAGEEQLTTIAEAETRLRAEKDEASRRAEEEATLRLEEETRNRANAEIRRRLDEKHLRIKLEEDSLVRRSEELVRRHAEVEAARTLAEEEARRLNEIQERITAAETGRRRAEHERLRLEAEVRLRAHKEQERLKETRNRIGAEQLRVDEIQARVEEEERKLEALMAVHKKAEQELQERARTEHHQSDRVDAVAPRKTPPEEFGVTDPRQASYSSTTN